MIDSLMSLMIRLGMAVVITVPTVGAGVWALGQLDHIGANERPRQQVIQDLVCEYTGQSPCPTVAPWVPVSEQLREMNPPLPIEPETTTVPSTTLPPVTTTTTVVVTIPPVTLPKLGL